MHYRTGVQEILDTLSLNEIDQRCPCHLQSGVQLCSEAFQCLNSSIDSQIED